MGSVGGGGCCGGGGGTSNGKLKTVTLKIALSDRSSNIECTEAYETS